MRVIAVAASGSTRYAQIGEDVDSNTGGDVGRDARASPAGFFCPRLARLYLCLRPYLYGWPLPLKLPLMVVSDPDPGSTTRIPTVDLTASVLVVPNPAYLHVVTNPSIDPPMTEPKADMGIGANRKRDLES
ncbi:hypothetical protein MRB53_036424 [Persea americana]|nr:hypothetical protein MRB53_036424 [Persea americana]